MSTNFQDQPPPPPPADGSAEFPDDAKIEGEPDELTYAKMFAADGELHGKAVGHLKHYLTLGYTGASSRYDEYDRVDEHLRMYVNLAAGVRRGDKTIGEGKENPFERAIVIPVAYSIYKTITTELFSIFAARNPFLNISGRAPEDEETSPNMTALLDYDHMQSKGNVAIYSMLADAVRYGQGVVFDHWEEVTRPGTVADASPLSQMAVAMGIVPASAVMGPVTVKQFNRWQPVDPFNFWRDPRVSPANFQEGDFAGHHLERSFNWLAERDLMKKRGPYFNLDSLKKQSSRIGQGRESTIVQRSRSASQELDIQTASTEMDRGYFGLDHLQVKIIPKDWEIPGGGEEPELWWFTLANESTIIRAHPTPFEHREFTYSIAEIDVDPHVNFNPGLIENLDGLQRAINWFMNSRMENVRKFLNDSMIWSPRWFQAADMLNPAPARWIRMTEELEDLVASGADISRFYSQMQVADVTAEHLKVVETLMEMVNRLSGASDPMAGVPTTEQKTLGEVQLLLQGASKRNAVIAEMIDTLAITPLAYRAIANRQQFTTMTQYARILGSASQEINPATGQPEMKPITKDDIGGDYDYTPHSALGPGDPRRAAATWFQIMGMYGSYPQLLQTPDERGMLPNPAKMLKEGVKNLGVRDFDSFYDIPSMPPSPFPPQGVAPSGQPGQAGVLPTDYVQQQAQAGNMAPVQG